MKLRAAQAGERRGGREAALTTPGRAGTARRCGFGKQGGKAYVRNQRVKPLNRPTSSNLADMGWVAARTDRRGAGRELLAGADALRREATVNAHGVVVAMPLGQSWAPTPPIGRVVNVGTVRCRPRLAQPARERAGALSAVDTGRGGGLVVVAGVTTRHGGREDRPQGEGGQQVRSRREGIPGDRR